MVILAGIVSEEKNLRSAIEKLKEWSTMVRLRIECGEKALEKMVLLSKKGILRGMKTYPQNIERAIAGSESLLKIMREELNVISADITDLFGRLEKLRSALEKPVRKMPKIVRST